MKNDEKIEFIVKLNYSATHVSLSGFILVLVITACTQQHPADVDYKGNYFFGREGPVDSAGNGLPKYSPANPAPKSEYDAGKYTAPVEQYSVAADVDSVSSADLPAPNAAAPATGSGKESLAPITAMTAPASTAASGNSYTSLPMQKQASTSAAPPQNFVWPIKGKIISAFAANKEGINIEARAGEPIRAAADGVVIYADNSAKQYGNMVVLQHGGGWVSSYAHAADLVVKKGDKIVQGQLIGFIGKTGNVTSPQLQFGLRKDEKPIDPQAYLK